VKALHHANRGTDKRRQKGFSLLELMVSVAILVIVAGAVIMGMIRMTWSQSTVMNRTQMHSSVRNATELMQQEVGQAGRVGSRPGLQFTTAITVPAGATSVVAVPTITTTATTPGTAATDRLYVGENLVVDPSTTAEETVTITAKTSTSIQATFINSHAANVPVLVLGGFASGIVPPDTSPTMLVLQDKDTASQPLTGGPGGTSSTGSVLKLYGDINGDGTMYYVTYNCNQAAGTLYRYVSNTADVNTATSLTYTLLLDNLGQNPPSSSPAPCFTYTTKDMPVTLTGGGTVTETFVTNVAVTLTVNTQNNDMQTGNTQTETKALLNIAPRNVVEALEQAGSPSGYTRAQPMPHNVYANLLSSSLPK
jgi:prepilin-type N-terminal cleavage/methylation domain-containing protein